jgi:hypothetical protein
MVFPVMAGRDSMAITVELGSDLKVGGMVLVAGSENQPASESRGLWRGASPNQSFSDGRAERASEKRSPQKGTASVTSMMLWSEGVVRSDID